MASMDLDSFLAQVGANIQKARWLAGLTQEAAAASVRISYRYYREVETGRRNPSLVVLADIARAFGVEVVDLVETPESRPMRPPLYSRKAVSPTRTRAHG